MRNLLFILFGACILFACNPDETTTPQPQTNNTSDTITLGIYTGALITDHISGGVHDKDTNENCQLQVTIYGTGTDPDTIMKVRITIPVSPILSLSAQGDVAASFEDSGTYTRMAVSDPCYNLFLRTSLDGNSVVYDQTSTCDPTTELHFTGIK